MDIKDYLHLYLGCDVYVFPDDTLTSGWLTKQLKKQPTLSYKYQLSIGNYKSTLDGGYKPILRPLSDMMEEEARQFCISEGWGENLENIAVTDGGIDFTIARTSGYCRFSRLRPSSFITLLSKGFDLFGLIEAGLAINKTKV